MTLPPSEDLPDDLINAYRRASAGDASQPSPQVRDSILSRAAHRPKTSQQAPVRVRVLSWQWKAAASLAVVGLVGVLTSQMLHTPQKTSERQSAASAPPPSPDGMRESAPTVTADSPSNDPLTNTPARTTARAAAPKPIGPSVSVSPSMPAPEAAQRFAAAPAPAAAASGASTRSADLVLQNSVVAAAPLDPWKVKTLEALRSFYPELFGTPASLSEARVEPVQIALVMNEDGTVYETAYETPLGQDQATEHGRPETPAERLTLALGVSPLELAAPARVIVFDRGTGQAVRIDVTVGIRKSR
jgi:hypothetical protein